MTELRDVHSHELHLQLSLLTAPKSFISEVEAASSTDLGNVEIINLLQVIRGFLRSVQLFSKNQMFSLQSAAKHIVKYVCIAKDDIVTYLQTFING